ncbi:MAG: thioredoxin domain-containing protein [Chloroflexi bacterium]|nr:thioredoxin domain-containing protein [Chloroflexota bacterium]
MIKKLVLFVLVIGALGLGLAANARAQGDDLCAQYPQYCAPLAGGAPVPYTQLEGPDSRLLPGDLEAAPGVVRGITAVSMPNNRNVQVPFIGDPNAPFQMMVVSNYACFHCQVYNRGDLRRFISDYVLNGQATVGFAALPTTAGDPVDASRAAQASLCAGEQGAFWEMHDAMFDAAAAIGEDEAFTSANIRQVAQDLGLDADTVMTCVNELRYQSWIDAQMDYAIQSGIPGTPAVLVLDRETGEWELAGRDYNELVVLVGLAAEFGPMTPGENGQLAIERIAPDAPRGVTPDGIPYLGSPDAPISFMVFHNFTCGHCRTYHRGELTRFIEEYVNTGQARLYSQSMGFGEQPYATDAALAALCAGEQDAYWEMADALFAQWETTPYQQVYTLDNIGVTAQNLGLDAEALAACVSSQRYLETLDSFYQNAVELGVTITPSTYVAYGDSDVWASTDRTYESMAALTNQPVAPEPAPVTIVPSPYDFTLSGLDGEEVALTDYRGGYVLVNFWATWCPPCTAELPDLNRFYETYRDQGFEILAINEGEDAATVRNFMSNNGYSIPVVLDENMNVGDQYKVVGIPSSFLFGPDGLPIQEWSGLVEYSQLEAVIVPLLEQ